MATIEKYQTSRGETRYMVRYRKPDHTSTKKRGFTRKKDAQEWLAKHAVIDIRQGTYTDPTLSRTTIGQIHEQWTQERTPYWKPSSLERRNDTWRLYLQDSLEHLEISRLTTQYAQQLISRIAATYSRSTTEACIVTLRGITRTAIRDHLIPNDPMTGIHPPKNTTDRRHRYITVPQLLSLADAAARGNRLTDPQRNRDIILLLGFCGLRWGELAGLRVEDIDLTANRIHIRHNAHQMNDGTWVDGTPKGGKPRSVPMPRIVADTLKRRVENLQPNDLVFPSPSGGYLRTVNRKAGGWWRGAFNRAGLDSMPAHDLRHTAASIAVHAGANVKALQRMLGHANASMTLDVYADLFDSDLDMVAANINRAITVAESGET
ncbi:site-specific integrase [Bifidobacterium tissieri]|nr:site-specific integrase [Bifidobacterium tissieri]